MTLSYNKRGKIHKMDMRSLMVKKNATKQVVACFISRWVWVWLRLVEWGVFWLNAFVTLLIQIISTPRRSADRLKHFLPRQAINLALEGASRSRKALHEEGYG